VKDGIGQRVVVIKFAMINAQRVDDRRRSFIALMAVKLPGAASFCISLQVEHRVFQHRIGHMQAAYEE